MTIHLGIGFDKNYLLPFKAWAASLESHNSHHDLHIHALCNDLPAGDLKEIKDRVSGFARFSLYQFDHNILSKFVIGNTWTTSVYFRLFLPELVPPDVETLIYMDLDTLVLGDLQELYTLKLKGYPLAAVYDNYVQIQPHLDILEEGNYFNSGVLLIDIKAWLNMKITDHAVRFLTEHPDKILYVDQCALNAVLRNNWLKISEKYNFLYSYLPQGISRKQLNNYLAEIIVLHFTLQRPWNMLCKNRYRYLYFHYLRKFGVRNSRKYEDFDLMKIPSWIRIRLTEFYIDQVFIQNLWRSVKHLLPGKTRAIN